MKKTKKRVFEFVEVANDGDIVSKAIDIFLIVLIIMNTAIVFAETFALPEKTKEILRVLETVSVIIFTIEYILRVWTADLLLPNLSPSEARIKYMFSFMALIDLLSILPFYIPYIIPIDLSVLRVLRIIRLLRLFKVTRYTTALVTIGDVFKKRANQLLSSIFVVTLLMVITSVLMYNVENPAQPDKFINAFSGLWWAVETLTTVGYGDIYPITVVGKILSGVIAVLGIGLVAVPTGIIASGFMEQIEISEKENDFETNHKTYCPYCGKKIDDDTEDEEK